MDMDVGTLIEIYEERAAIREYDGGYSRPTAERLGREDMESIAKNMGFSAEDVRQAMSKWRKNGRT